MEPILGGILFWGLIGGLIFLIRPRSFVHREFAAILKKGRMIALVLLVILLIMLVCFLMTLSPVWNGTFPGSGRGAYEQMTEFLLQGHLDYIGETDPKLLELENPYDPELRAAVNASYPWDWAYYKGRFYMYFGVVPILLVFLPYRLLIGHVPATVHVSQLFAGLYIVGLAVTFFWWVKNRFRKITLGELASLLVLLSLVSTVYVVKYPVLYQTPVVCGMCLEIWSLFFFTKAIWEDRSERSALRLAFFGSLLGALSFGCRPTLAMANLLVIPMLAHFLRGKRLTPGLLGRLFLAASPYFAVAAGLMLYNYVRFENPFEFGQAYQLTLADQTKLGNLMDPENLIKVPTGIFKQLFMVPGVEPAFPFLQLGTGIFISCPLLLFAFTWMKKEKQPNLKEQDFSAFTVFVSMIALLIIAIQILKTPIMWDRYRSDYLWLLCFGAWIGIGKWNEGRQDVRSASRAICLGVLFCLVLAGAVFLIPHDASFTEYFPNTNQRIWEIITFGLAG